MGAPYSKVWREELLFEYADLENYNEMISEMGQEERIGFEDLFGFFEIDIVEHRDALKKELTYTGSDVVYHNYEVKGTNIIFCLLKADSESMKHVFKKIEFFEKGLHIKVVPFEMVIDHLPENMCEHLIIQIGRLFREDRI